MKAATPRSVAERVSLMSLTPSAVAAVLNNSSASHSVPEHTKRRIAKAARDSAIGRTSSRVLCGSGALTPSA
jgi:DNA-binding LacI/PurR family transcriptional regulator